MKMFGSSLRGLPPPPPPGAAGTAQPGLLGSPNLEFFMRQEFHTISRYCPDLERIRANSVNMLTCAGSLSEEVYYARTAKVLAEAVGCPFRTISGHHLSFAADPATFVNELRGLLEELKSG